MFDRLGRDASARPWKGSRARAKAVVRLQLEPLEGRSLMTASLAPIPSVTVEAGAGFQVPLNGATGGNLDPQTYTVTTDNATGGVKATTAVGQFWTIGVSHVSSGAANDPSFTGTMTLQLFQDLTPNSAAKIEALITGTAPYSSLTAAAQKVIYPGGPGTTGLDYYVVGGNTFHRIASGFGGTNSYIVQAGSLNGNGTGQVYATSYALETSPQEVFNGRGQLALANSGGTTSNDSQFFITTGSPRFLDGKYTIFGQLVSGSDTLSKIAAIPGPTGSTDFTPTSKVTITSATLSGVNPNGVVHVDATGATSGTVTNVTVTATDAVDNTQTSRTFPVVTIPLATASEPSVTAPQLTPVPTPVSTPTNKATSFQLSASNPEGGTLSYSINGGVASGTVATGPTFTPVQNGTATVSSTGLVTVTPNAGYTGPINLVVGVRDQINRAGTGQALNSPANFSLQNVTVTVGAFSTAPKINPVLTPIAGAINTPTTVQLSATNPTGGVLTYTVQGGLTNGAFTPVQNATATVSPTGLLTVTPNAGYTGPINLLVGVRDQTNRAGTGQSLDSPANFSNEPLVINVAGVLPVAPRINPVTTPITSSISQTVTFQLSAINPGGGTLSYTVQGGYSNGAFTAVKNATATVSASGLVTVTPDAGYTGPINLLVGVRDQFNRQGSVTAVDSPGNFSAEQVVINVLQPVSTGTVRFILNSTGGATGNLIVTPLPQAARNAENVIQVTQSNGNIEVIVNGAVDLNQPSLADVNSITVYGSKANDRITIDPSLTNFATLNGGTGGKDVLAAGGGPTRQHGWYGTVVEKQGASNNYLFGRKGHVTFVKGSGTSDVIFAGTPSHQRGHSRIRQIPAPPKGTFYKFVGSKLEQAADPFTTKPASTTSARKK